MVTQDEFDRFRAIVREEVRAAMGGPRPRKETAVHAWLVAGTMAAVAGRDAVTMAEVLSALALKGPEAVRWRGSVGATLLSLGWTRGGRRGGRKVRERFYVAPKATSES